MSKPINDGGPAFTFKCQGPTTAPEFYYGMSMRDWFAGQVVGAYVSHRELGYESASEAAYRLADAMLAARERNPQ